MLRFQPTLWCPIQSASLCLMDPEPLCKFLFSTNVFASGAEFFGTALLPGPTQDFTVLYMKLRENNKMRYVFLEFLREHAKQQLGRLSGRWYTVLQEEAYNMSLLWNLR